MSPAEEKALLQQGIAAARAGDKATARARFRELTAHNFDNELAWLWLASVADTPAHAMACLRRVLQMNATHEKARAALFRLVMEQGIQQARAGEKAAAYASFVEGSSLEARNELVWTWMASTAPGPNEALNALRHVLHINPTHAQAGRAYKKLVVQHGIDLAQSGNAELARELLTEATRLEPENETVLLWLARSVPAEEAIEHYTRILTLNPDHDVARAALEQLRPAPPAAAVDEYASMFTSDGRVEQALELEAVSAEEEADAHAFELEQVDDDEIAAAEAAIAAAREAEAAEAMAAAAAAAAAADAQPTIASQPSTHEEFLVYQNQDATAVWAPEGQSGATATAVEDIPSVDLAAQAAMVAPSDVDSYVAASESTYATTEAEAQAHADLEYTSTHEDHLISAASTDAVEMELDQPEAVSELEATVDTSLDATADIDADAEVAAAAMASDAPPPSTPANIVVAWNCPICLSGAPEEAHRCPTCGSVPTLVDPDLLLETEPVDRRYVLQVIARMKNRRVSGASALFDHHLTLGLAYINAGRLPEGMQHLRKASETRPRDAEFKAQVDAVERQAKAKASASARSSKTNGKAVKTPAPATPAVEVPLAPVAAATHDTHDSGHAHTNGNGHQEGRRIILVVDDSPTIQKVVSVTLEAHGHEVVTASDGMEALSKLRTLKPDLVLLDITMPHMDGYQLCRIMRSNDITRNVPIVMLSGKDGLFDKMRGRMAGAASYITKPFAPSTLPPLIDKYCKRAS
jgi:twitching motility two-component system response regulator PilG